MLIKNKIFLTLVLFTVSCGILFGQATAQKPKIPPPSHLDLAPQISGEQVKNDLDEFRKKLNGAKKLPSTLSEYMKQLERAAKREKDDKTGEEIKEPPVASVSSVRNLRRIYYRLITHPDLEEVTGVNIEWFHNVYNATENIRVPAKYIEHALIVKDEALYEKARDAYVKGIDSVLDAMKAKMPKLNSEKLQIIKDKNKKRREKEYYLREEQKLKAAAAAAAAAKKNSANRSAEKK